MDAEPHTKKAKGDPRVFIIGEGWSYHHRTRRGAERRKRWLQRHLRGNRLRVQMGRDGRKHVVTLVRVDEDG
jgi:hypothetical protein